MLLVFYMIQMSKWVAEAVFAAARDSGVQFVTCNWRRDTLSDSGSYCACKYTPRSYSR